MKTTLAVVHGVPVTEYDQLVPSDGRLINPKMIPYYEYEKKQEPLKVEKLAYVRANEWRLLERAHWQTCTCPICGQSVIIPDWSLHVLMHTRDIRIIGIILSAVMSMFNDEEDQQEPAKAA